MTKNNYNWDLLPNFECWEFDDPKYKGSGDCINIEALLNIVQLRLVAGCPIITHGPVGGCVDVHGLYGHAPNSFHLLAQGCSAVDFHFDTETLTERQQWNLVKGSGFRGIGVYYGWEWEGELLKIGFHGDMRPSKLSQTWKRENGKYTYFLR